VGSKTLDGIRFAAYTNDHLPPHIHGFYSGVEVIVDLLIDQGAVRQSNRDDSIRPANAKKSDVNHVLRTAADHFRDIVNLWEAAQP
jgi:hypothetical protein